MQVQQLSGKTASGRSAKTQTIVAIYVEVGGTTHKNKNDRSCLRVEDSTKKRNKEKVKIFIKSVDNLKIK